MRKMFIVSLLLLVSIMFAMGAYADTSNVCNMRDTNYSVAVADGTQGYMMKVDSDGRSYVRDMGGHTISSGYGDRLVYTGECVVHKVIVQGQAADDYAAVYDRVTVGTQDDVKADPQSATAKQVAPIDLGGALFSTGIYVDTPNANVLTTVVYDSL